LIPIEGDGSIEVGDCKMSFEQVSDGSEILGRHTSRYDASAMRGVTEKETISGTERFRFATYFSHPNLTIYIG